MGSADSIGADQRANLYRTKLTSLVRLLFPQTDPDAISVSGFNGGAVATLPDRSIIMVNSSDGVVAFGAGLLKCRSVARIDVWVDESVPAPVTAVIARCSEALVPVESVEVLSAKTLHRAVAAPRQLETESVPRTDPWVELMGRVGLTVEWSDGEIIGSLRGLEAARIATNADGTTRLDVGVGKYDQSAFAMMNANLAPDEALHAVTSQIREWRVRDAPSHPINRLGRTRWLASTIVEDPSQVGLVTAERLDLGADPGIRAEAPVSLVGSDADGEAVGVVVAVGLDPSMIPNAADLAVCGDVSRLVLVVPDRDRYALLDEMAHLLSVPSTVTSIALPWSDSVP